MSSKKYYNLIERMLHHVAFSVPFVQKILSDLESDIYAKDISKIKLGNEVFVAGLPRSGTTLLLELLYNTGEFNTFTYRNMPFILSPLLWGKISKPFHQSKIEKDRSHGDGMKMSFDSPEAFEEIIWLSVLKNKIIKENRIETLSALDASTEISSRLQNSVKKILFSEFGGENKGGGKVQRYLSKNNANISRPGLVLEIFPSSHILVPFRNPSMHVTSLYRVHSQFSREHKNDSFSKKYMKWLGHFDFGENFKPVNFDGWVDLQNEKKINENYFMKYWTAAYSFLLTSKTDNIIFIDFDKLLIDQGETLSKISDVLKLKNKEVFVNSASILRSPTTQKISMESKCMPEDWGKAQEIYSLLKEKAI